MKTGLEVFAHVNIATLIVTPHDNNFAMFAPSLLAGSLDKFELYM